jgi:hypothetical protein
MSEDDEEDRQLQEIFAGFPDLVRHANAPSLAEFGEERCERWRQMARDATTAALDGRPFEEPWPRIREEMDRVRRGKGLTLALDIEGTLVVSAGWPWSRPGLRDFLEWARDAFERLVFFTTVPPDQARQVMEFLVSRSEAPAWVLDLEVWNPEILAVPWGEPVEQKDLARLGDPAKAFLVDDYPPYAVPSQRDRLVLIGNFDGDPKDRELARVREELERRILGD